MDDLKQAAIEAGETFTTDQVIHAIRKFLEFGQDQYGKSQQGYFSGGGWAARCLRAHLAALEADAAQPEDTVPWLQVTRYTGGASPEGVAGRIWVRVSDAEPDVEYVPAQPKPAATVKESLTPAAPAVESEPFLGWRQLLRVWRQLFALEPPVGRPYPKREDLR